MGQSSSRSSGGPAIVASDAPESSDATSSSTLHPGRQHRRRRSSIFSLPRSKSASSTGSSSTRAIQGKRRNSVLSLASRGQRPSRQSSDIEDAGQRMGKEDKASRRASIANFASSFSKRPRRRGTLKASDGEAEVREAMVIEEEVGHQEELPQQADVEEGSSTPRTIEGADDSGYHSVDLALSRAAADCSPSFVASDPPEPDDESSPSMRSPPTLPPSPSRFATTSSPLPSPPAPLAHPVFGPEGHPSWPAPPSTPPEERDALLGERNAIRDLIAGVMGGAGASVEGAASTEPMVSEAPAADSPSLRPLNGIEGSEGSEGHATTEGQTTAFSDGPGLPDMIPLAPANTEGDMPVMVVPAPARRIVVQGVVQSGSSALGGPEPSSGSEAGPTEETALGTEDMVDADTIRGALPLDSDHPSTSSAVPADVPGSSAGNGEPDEVPVVLTPSASTDAPSAAESGPSSDSTNPVLAQQATLIARLLSVAAAATAATLLPGTLNADGTLRSPEDPRRRSLDPSTRAVTEMSVSPTGEPPSSVRSTPPPAAEHTQNESTETPASDTASAAPTSGLQSILRDALRAAFGEGLVHSGQNQSIMHGSPPRSPTVGSPEESDQGVGGLSERPSPLSRSLSLPRSPSRSPRSLARPLWSALLNSRSRQRDRSAQSAEADVETQPSAARHPPPEGSFERFLRQLQTDVGAEILRTLGATPLPTAAAEIAGSSPTAADPPAVPEALASREAEDEQPAAGPPASEDRQHPLPALHHHHRAELPFSFFRMHRFDPSLAQEALGANETDGTALGLRAGPPSLNPLTPSGAMGIGGERHTVGEEGAPAPHRPVGPRPAAGRPAHSEPALIPIILVGVRSAPPTTSPLPRMPDSAAETSPSADRTDAETTSMEDASNASVEADSPVVPGAFGLGLDEVESVDEMDTSDETASLPSANVSTEPSSPTEDSQTSTSDETSSSGSSNMDANSRSWLIFVLAGIYPAS